MNLKYEKIFRTDLYVLSDCKCKYLLNTFGRYPSPTLPLTDRAIINGKFACEFFLASKIRNYRVKIHGFIKSFIIYVLTRRLICANFMGNPVSSWSCPSRAGPLP